MDGVADVIAGSTSNYVAVFSGVLAFQTGDTLVGAVSSTGDVDERAFPGLAEMKLKVRFKPTSGNLKPRILVIDPLGNVIVDWILPNRKSNRQVWLERDGLHRLRIESTEGTTGGYSLKTRRVLRGSALSRSGQRKGDENGGLIQFMVRALPGSTLSGSFTPIRGFPGFPSARLIQPDGAQQFITPFVSTRTDKTLKLKRIPLTQLGLHELWIFGWNRAGRSSGVDVGYDREWRLQLPGEASVSRTKRVTSWNRAVWSTWV